MSEREQLGVQDALWLEMDRPSNLMVVDSLMWTAEAIDWNRFTDVVRERLWDRYRVFRSVAVNERQRGFAHDYQVCCVRSRHPRAWLERRGVVIKGGQEVDLERREGLLPEELPLGANADVDLVGLRRGGSVL